MNENNSRSHFLTLCKFALIVFLVSIPNVKVWAQTAIAPNQCTETPTFPQGTIMFKCPVGRVTGPIYTENFDTGFGDFTENPPPAGTTNDLTLSTDGDTPSAGTGPETTASCNVSSNDGEFVFLEGSSTLINETHCMSNSIDLTQATAPLALSFWFYMFGDNIGELSVKLNDSEEFSKSGQQQTQNGQAWQQAILNLDSFAGTMLDVEVCMSEGNGSVSTFESDLSVDQFEVYGCAHPPETCYSVKGDNDKAVTFCL